MNRKILFAIGTLTLILSACGTSAQPDQAERVSAPAATEAPTEAAQPTEAPSPAPTEAPAAAVRFAEDVLPILNNSCNKCHGVEQVKEGLDMTSYEKLMQGSFNGPVVTPGNATDSLLIDLVVRGKMPKRGEKLTPGQIQIISDWINAGAPNN